MKTPAETDRRPPLPDRTSPRTNSAPGCRWLARALVFSTSFLISVPTAISIARHLREGKRSPVDEFADRLLNLDAQARSAAALGTPVLLGIDQDGHRFIAAKDLGGGDVDSVGIPNGMDVSLSTSHATASRQVRFDCDGRSSDYEIALRGCSASIRISVAGLTGWATVVGMTP